MSHGKHRKQTPTTRRNLVISISVATAGIPALVAGTAGVASAAPVAEVASVTPRTVPQTEATPRADVIVRAGDTLSGIARDRGFTLDELKPLNPGIIAGDRPDDYSLIFAGGHVHLPADDGTVVEPPAPPVDETPPPVVEEPPPVADPGDPVIPPDCPGQTESGYSARGVHEWRPLVEQAMGLVGGNVNANHNVDAVLSLMLSESSGDPNANNGWDSNAAMGDPSRGLMQTIGSTFNAYHVDGTSDNIFDPLANISASLNYINDVYGGVIPNSPY